MKSVFTFYDNLPSNHLVSKPSHGLLHCKFTATVQFFRTLLSYQTLTKSSSLWLKYDENLHWYAKYSKTLIHRTIWVNSAANQGTLNQSCNQQDHVASCCTETFIPQSVA